MRSHKFKFKVDPRDISSVFLYDEEKEIFVEIPNADPEFGHISLEEYEYLQRVLRKNGFKTDTKTIMAARERLDDLITGSKKEKESLIRGFKKAGTRARDMAVHPKTSIRKHDEPQNPEQPWTPKDFEVEVPD